VGDALERSSPVALAGRRLTALKRSRSTTPLTRHRARSPPPSAPTYPDIRSCRPCQGSWSAQSTGVGLTLRPGVRLAADPAPRRRRLNAVPLGDRDQTGHRLRPRLRSQTVSAAAGMIYGRHPRESAAITRTRGWKAAAWTTARVELDVGPCSAAKATTSAIRRPAQRSADEQLGEPRIRGGRRGQRPRGITTRRPTRARRRRRSSVLRARTPRARLGTTAKSSAAGRVTALRRSAAPDSAPRVRCFPWRRRIAAVSNLWISFHVCSPPLRAPPDAFASRVLAAVPRCLGSVAPDCVRKIPTTAGKPTTPSGPTQL